MPRTYRLAVLECDTPLDAVVKERGTYGTIFRNLFQRGLDQYRRDSHVADEVELVVTHSNMVELGPLPDLKDVDGLVLTGSSAFRPLPPSLSPSPPGPIRRRLVSWRYSVGEDD